MKDKLEQDFWIYWGITLKDTPKYRAGVKVLTFIRSILKELREKVLKMKENNKIVKKEFILIIKEIKSIIHKARYNVFNAVNTEMLKAYYEIGMLCCMINAT